MEQLPENWWIAVTPENKRVLGKWRECGSLMSITTDGYVLSNYSGNRGYYMSNNQSLPLGYIEISFSDFQRLILKEEVKPIYELF